MPEIPLLALPAHWQIAGPTGGAFRRVTVSGGDADRHSLCLTHEEAEIRRGLRRGCRLFAGEGPRPPLLAHRRDAAWIALPDRQQALMQLAAMFRARSDAKRIAVTGSSGKTNTKDMIAHLLRRRYPGTARTPGNLNDYEEVPLVITRLPANAPFWVVEIGLDYHQKNGIQPRAAALRPQVAVVTNVGVSHIGFVGSVATAAAEKSQIVRELEPGGLAVLNGDNRYCREMAGLTDGPVVFFGLGPENQVRASDVRQSWRGLRFTLWVDRRSIRCFLPLIGLYHVQNALAAAAVAVWAGLDLPEIARGLRNYRAHRQHGRIHRVGGATIVDDGYNSNPPALRGVLDTLDALPHNRPKVLVLGDMQLLGADSAWHYRQLASELRRTDLTAVICFGRRIRATYDALPRRSRYFWAANAREAVWLLREYGLARHGLIWLKSNIPREYARLRRLLLRQLASSGRAQRTWRKGEPASAPRAAAGNRRPPK